MRYVPSSVHLFYLLRYLSLTALTTIVSVLLFISENSYSAERLHEHLQEHLQEQSQTDSKPPYADESATDALSAIIYAGKWLLRDESGDPLEQQVRSLVRRKLQRWHPDEADIATAQGEMAVKNRKIETLVKQDLERLMPAFLLTVLNAPQLTILVKSTEFSIAALNQSPRLLYLDGRLASLSLKDFQRGKNTSVAISGWENGKIIAETTTWNGTRIVEQFSLNQKQNRLKIDYSIFHPNFASPVKFRRIYRKVD